ncbi:unnamed protein product [Allacma fusca]|uniref:Xaa-Pro aminopeptidase 1 n=1 Tax=Allacma fusca TaxID=39272 RepID=A0A8J2M2P1_9HEXA|nr:unnamed protein product [Allacma fusca]
MFTPKNTTLILRQLRLLMQVYLELGTFEGQHIIQSPLKNSPLDAYIVPSADAHHNIRIAECDQRRAYVSGFDGSAGTAIITLNDALLWTDGRYYTQASQQLDENWTLMKDGQPNVPSQSEWLVRNLPANSTVGVDAQQYSKSEWDAMSFALQQAGKRLVAVENLIDKIWEDRPERPKNVVLQLPLEFSGKLSVDKITQVRKEMRDAGASILIISELDEVAWLLNLRGSDLPLAPVFFSYVILTAERLDVFMGLAKLSREIIDELTNQIQNIHFYEYEDIYSELSEYNTNYPTDGKIWLSRNCNYGLATLVPDERLLVRLTPISLMKATKNPTEVAGMKRAFIRDGAAVTAFYAWLESAMKSGANLTEISAADKLYEFRSKARNFVSLSFKTISGSGPNGAIIHYWPTEDSDRNLSLEEMYLVDSGAHYLDGTTDVTRTFHFGQPTDYQRNCFTRVLKGQIAMATLRFPWGVTGHTIDSFARRSLWEVGLDYAHGTGHGIGAYLNVGEGPQSVSYDHNPDDPGLRENMIVSNEPGYYEEDNFGIRLENAERIVNSSVNNFLEMEDLTFVPYQRSLIMIELLTDAEIRYLNAYFESCRNITGKYMNEYPLDNGEGLAWLERETQPLVR